MTKAKDIKSNAEERYGIKPLKAAPSGLNSQKNLDTFAAPVDMVRACTPKLAELLLN